MRLAKILLVLSFSLLTVCSVTSAGESSAERLAVLPSTDNSTFQIPGPLQSALVSLFQDEKQFEVLTSSESLDSFNEADIKAAFEKLQVSYLSFSVLEQNRISVFIFSHQNTNQFIASSKLFSQGSELEGQLRAAVQEALNALKAKQFKFLPGAVVAQSDSQSSQLGLSENSRALFRELSSMTDSPIYMGAQIGMARLANKENTSSTVVFGVSGGYQFHPQWSAEAGLSVSSYLMGTLGGRYHIPIMEKVIKLSIGFDVASILGPVSQNSSYNSDPQFSYSPNIKTGSILAGPGVFFDIPLLGAALRGDLRFFTGSSTVLVGTYGFIYYL